MKSYEEILWEQADTICNCKYLRHLDDDTYEDHERWFDCTHPQKESETCKHRLMKECKLAVPDNEQQKEQVESCLHAEKFWEKWRKDEDKKEHICDIPDKKLKERHKNVLSLIEKYDPISIGTLIAGKYYGDIWSSRSCSHTMSRLVGNDDYMDFYCGSSVYYAMKNVGGINPIHKDFEDMDKRDRETS